MGKSLSELDLKDEVLPGGSLEDLPDFGGFSVPPQPGVYRFKLPVMKGVLATFEMQKDGQKVTRLRVEFDSAHPLTILQAKDPKYIGDTFEPRISGGERKRGKDQQVEASEIDYLLKALGVKEKPVGLRAQAALVEQQTGKEFSAEVTYSWFCSKERDLRVADQEGNVQVVEGKKGCGAKYYQSDKTAKAESKVERLADGTYPVEVTCACGNRLRAFANLDNFRA